MSNPVLPPTVIIDPNRGYREWLSSEIYEPGNSNSTGMYVPNVNDAIRDWSQGILRVTAVDYTTGISTKVRWSEPVDPGTVTDEDILLGAGPGTQSESYRLYLDQSVFPHTLSCDARLHLYGSTIQSVKIFLGTDISENGDIISAFYDTSGNFLGDNIPVELVAMFKDGVVFPGSASSAYNTAVKTPMVGYTTRSISDGEVCTLVGYDVAGQAVTQAKLLIKNTAFVRQTDTSIKYVSDIFLKTPFLLSSDPTVVEYPINMPVQSLNLMAEVIYSDGSRKELPVDGTKFKMNGLTNYVATIQGQTVPLTLSYQLASNESPYLTTISPNRRINKPYWARTRESDGAYSVKLYVFPVWIDALNGYRLEYLLYNGNRQQVYNVTQLVTHATNSAPFDPLLYNVKQRLSVGVNMNEVDPIFTSWRHTQNVEITLLRPGNNASGDNWTIAYTAGQDPEYGVGVRANYRFINVNNNKLDLTCGKQTLDEWLDTVYYPLQPLFDSRTEVGPLVPNYFVVVVGNSRTEYPISSWNAEITVATVGGEGKLCCLEFIRKTANNDLQLAVAGMILHQVS